MFDVRVGMERRGMRRHDGAPRRERRHGRRWAGGPAGGVPSTAVRDRFEQSSRGLVGSGRQARAMNPEVRRTPVRREHARASGSTPERHPAPSPRDGLFFFLPARETTRGMGTRDLREARRAMPAKSKDPPRGAVRFFFSGWHPPMLQMIRRRRYPARRDDVRGHGRMPDGHAPYTTSARRHPP